MTIMMRRQAGANFPVLQLYYVQAVSSLVDYRASVLIALYHHQQKRLEGVQNKAMRTNLQAWMWCSACVKQSEAKLVPLTARVQYIAACRVA